MSALDELFIEIEKHPIMRGHSNLLLESKKELARYKEMEAAILEFVNGRTPYQYKLAYDKILTILGKG